MSKRKNLEDFWIQIAWGRTDSDDFCQYAFYRDTFPLLAESKNHKMFVRFVSDSQLTERGFEIEVNQSRNGTGTLITVNLLLSL